MRRGFAGWVIGLATALGGLSGPSVVHGEEASPGGTYRDWLEHRQAVLATPGLVRYYTFEEVRAPAGPIRNLAGAGAALDYQVAEPGSAAKTLNRISGRWPEKKAVRLDRGFLASAPFDASARGMTAAAWLRVVGMGSIEGSPVRTGGTLLSTGSGYWDGWRVTFKYPEKALGFEIGRPKPSWSVGINRAGGRRRLASPSGELGRARDADLRRRPAGGLRRARGQLRPAAAGRAIPHRVRRFGLGLGETRRGRSGPLPTGLVAGGGDS